MRWSCYAVYFFWNFCYRQGKTGQTIGKSMLKFMVISDEYRLRAGGYAAAATQAVSRIATLKRLMSRAPF